MSLICPPLKGLIATTNEVILSPFEMQTMPDISKVTGYGKQVHVITEPKEHVLSNEVVATSTYDDLKPGSSRVKICLQNLTLKMIVIPTCYVMGQLQAANEVPEMYAPVTPKGCLVMGATTLRNENHLRPRSISSGSENFDQFPANTKPRAPAPDRTILKQITCQAAHLGLQRIVRRLQICCQSLQAYSLDMTWTWGRPQ